MASGHVNRTQRPNTWLHRPTLRREDSPCQLGAVHTWPFTTGRLFRADRRSRGIADMAGPAACLHPVAHDPSRSSAAKFAVMHHTALIRRCGRVDPRLEGSHEATTR